MTSSKFAVAATLALATLALPALFAPAAAQSRIDAGMLECRGAGSTSFIIGSVHDLDCVFRPTFGPRQVYRGTARKFGLDIGVTRDSVMVWTVLGPTRRLGPNSLWGNYAGVSAGAAVGVGVGANALVGGSNDQFVLQPLSVEARAGLNIALGVASLQLR